MREEDYSRMVRFFGGGLFSSSGFLPVSAIALGFSWRRKMRGREMMEVGTSGFAEHRRVIFISSGGTSGVMTGQCALMGIPNDEVSSLGGQRPFQQNSVHDSRMKIFCESCAKGQVFVRIRLDEKFPNVFEMMKIRIHRLKKSSQDEYKRYIFIFIDEIL
jgi:hypothetical protein